MVEWYWLVVVGFATFCLGILAVTLAACAHQEDAISDPWERLN